MAGGGGADVEDDAAARHRRARRGVPAMRRFSSADDSERLLEARLARSPAPRSTAPPCTRRMALLPVEEVEVGAHGDVGDLERLARGRRRARSRAARSVRASARARSGSGQRFAHAAIVRRLRLLVNTKAMRRLDDLLSNEPKGRRDALDHQARAPPRRRPRAHLLRRRRHDARPRARARPARARAAPGDRDDAPGRAHRRVGLDRRRPAEPRLPAAGRARPARAGDAGATRPRCRASTTSPCSRTSRRRSARCSRTRTRPTRPRRPRDGRPRPHPHLGRPLRGRLLQPGARPARSAASRPRAPAP